MLWEKSAGAYMWSKYSLKHGPGAQTGGFPCETPLDIGSLNDAPVVWYISKGPASNRCHVTAIHIMDRRTPNLDPKVFSSTLGNIIFPTVRNAKCDQNAKFYANDNFILN